MTDAPTVPVNKTMDRDDLLTPEGSAFVAELNELAEELDRRRLPVTSWYGSLAYPRFEFSVQGARAYARRLLGRTRRVGSQAEVNRGGSSYEPVPGISNDALHPWFLYWEAYWATRRGPSVSPGARILDAGGTASLFSCHLASRGLETHSVDLNPRLVRAGEETARAMGWNLVSYCMDMTALTFDDASFDHAYSICVFEHLDAGQRRRALEEIARVLKPGGTLAITFDYGGPGVYLADSGPNFEPANLIRSLDDVERHFCPCPALEVWGNREFFDNGKRYLAWPDDPALRYTFGAVFLRKAG